MESLQLLFSGFGFVLILILTVINLIIYHKIFQVTYFDLGNALFKEFAGAFLLACLEVSLFSGLLHGLWGITKGILGFLIKAIIYMEYII